VQAQYLSLFSAVARGLKAIRWSERAGKIPEGINALTVIAAQHSVEHQQHSRMKNHDLQAEVSKKGTPNGRCHSRSTVKRLIEYPSAPPMKTSDKKWTLSESRENPTSEARP
jgi:hypothetical protein